MQTHQLSFSAAAAYFYDHISRLPGADPRCPVPQVLDPTPMDRSVRLSEHAMTRQRSCCMNVSIK